MTYVTLSARPQATKQPAGIAAVSIGSLLYFSAAISLLHFVRPELNPIGNPTSAYAVGPYSFLMTSAFFSMSVGSLALVLGLYRRMSHSARFWIGLVLLSAWAAGVAIAMFFPMDVDGAPPTTSGTIHQVAGPITFLSLTVGMFFMSWAFTQDEKWRPFDRLALTLSLVMLTAFVATFLSFATDSGTIGIAQRVALTTAVTWMLLTAARLRSTAPGNAP